MNRSSLKKKKWDLERTKAKKREKINTGGFQLFIFLFL